MARVQGLDAADLDERVSRHITEGGDDRLHLGEGGVNKYYCAPRPLAPTVMVRSSCTCSSPTVEGFEYAKKTLHSIQSAAISFHEAVEDIRRRLSKVLLSIDDNNTKEYEVVLHPSGSDAELVPLAVAQARREKLLGYTHINNTSPVVNIVCAAGEVGSGTAPASGGRHFSDYAPNGSRVESGTLIRGFKSIEVYELSARNAAGKFDPASYDDYVRSAISRARAEYGDPIIVLHVVDGSKTGLRVPSKGLVDEYTADESVIIVVDACQGRSKPADLSWYIQRNCVVLYTASKFYQAPGFCGVVLLPGNMAAELNEWTNLPDGFKDYLSKYEVPASMPGIRTKLSEEQNIGLLLRWAIGVREMELYHAIEDTTTDEAISKWVTAARKLVVEANGVELLVDPENPKEDMTRLRACNSVVSFKVLRGDGGEYFDAKTLKKVHRLLTIDASAKLPASATAHEKQAAAVECMVGQPVNLGRFGVLRLAIGAPLARWIATNGLEGEIEKDKAILEKVRVICKHWDGIIQ